MVQEALEAASTVATEDDAECEVIDLRTIAPLDTDAVLESVRRTGRALIVHEATRTCGVGAEVAARITEHAFEFLDAPVRRVTAPDTPVPYSPPLEKAFRPGAASIALALRGLLAY